MKILRFIVFSLVVGALFGWAMTTKFSTCSAVASGTAASAFMLGGMIYNDRIERREMAQRSKENEEEAGA